MKERGATPVEDLAHPGWTSTGTISKVTESENGWSITYADHWCVFIEKSRLGWPISPQVGDSLTTFGGVGYQFHGQALNGVILWYLTIEQEAAERQAWLDDLAAKRLARFIEREPAMDAMYAALPAPFQRRIDRFRAKDPVSFRVNDEELELRLATDAVKVATLCKTIEALEAWKQLPPAEQTKTIEDGHSGHSYAMLCVLAAAFINDPESVS